MKTIQKIFQLLFDFLIKYFSETKEKDIKNEPDPPETYVTKEQALENIAVKLGIEQKLLTAFLKTESSKDECHKIDGKLVINYEQHIFEKLTNGKKVKDLNIIKRDKLNQQDEWRNFEEAKKVNREKAFESVSMGSPQIMGFNHAICGYISAEEMFDAFDKSEINAIVAFGKFIDSNPKLVKACREKNYHKMAYFYNGAGYKKYKDRQGRTYADRIRENYTMQNKKNDIL